MVHIPKVLPSSVRTAFENFGSTAKRVVSPPNITVNTNPPSEKKDEFTTNTESTPLTSEERTQAAVRKFNTRNEELLAKEINISGVNGTDTDGVYDKLLLLYSAYKNPEFKDVTFTTVSSDTVVATYKG